jgi:ribosomal protein S18
MGKFPTILAGLKYSQKSPPKLSYVNRETLLSYFVTTLHRIPPSRSHLGQLCQPGQTLQFI